MPEDAVTLPVRFLCNGREVTVAVRPDATLATTLRDGLGLTGTKIGCETGDCGACTVELDGAAVCSCIVVAVRCDGSEVRTVEGIAASPLGALVVDAFADADAVQCGICTPGFVVSAANLISEQPGPLTKAEIVAGLAGNLCRCTGYQPLLRAVEQASLTWAARTRSAL